MPVPFDQPSIERRRQVYCGPITSLRKASLRVVGPDSTPVAANFNAHGHRDALITEVYRLDNDSHPPYARELDPNDAAGLCALAPPRSLLVRMLTAFTRRSCTREAPEPRNAGSTTFDAVPCGTSSSTTRVNP